MRSRLPLPLLPLSLAVFIPSVYLGALYAGPKPTSQSKKPVKARENCTRDAALAKEETWTGIKLLRWYIARKCTGDVLECAVGTARNVNYINWTKVRSYTYTDTSKEMLAIATKKTQDMLNMKKITDIPIEAIQVAAEANNIIQPVSSLPNESIAESSKVNPKFDTILQTFALCSREEPKTTLRNMAGLLKDDGKIFLIEHGRSKYAWLNRTLDSGAEDHHTSWGCWWNRDIVEMLSEAELHTHGLRLETIRRFHFGTTYVLTLSKIPQRISEPEKKDC